MKSSHLLKDFTLIIADDDPIHRMLLNIHFRELEMKILEASNGQELFELLASLNGAPVILLLDLHMPDLDGYEVISKMKAQPDLYKNVKTIVLSGSSALDLDKDWIHEYVFGFVEKPINKAAMIEMIQLAAS
ncbi:MAG: response regulator [Chitinophagaceae bacterium]|nr:response regulator [Chitinophagaceae bacterium]